MNTPSKSPLSSVNTSRNRIMLTSCSTISYYDYYCLNQSDHMTVVVVNVLSTFPLGPLMTSAKKCTKHNDNAALTILLHFPIVPSVIKDNFYPHFASNHSF